MTMMASASTQWSWIRGLVYVPASVSPDLVTGVLKGKLGFKGIVWSDDLWYPNITERYGAEGVALLSLQAGRTSLQER